jgi:hypothetical protein
MKDLLCAVAACLVGVLAVMAVAVKVAVKRDEKGWEK